MSRWVAGGSSGSSYTDAQAVAANAAALAGKAPQLTPTATKTAAYTAAVGDLAVMNVAAGATTLTLPTAPADKSVVGFLAIGATTAAPLTVTPGGTDTLGPAGATSVAVPLVDEVTVYQYQASSTRWLAVSNVKPLAALDARYDTAGAATAARGSSLQKASNLSDVATPATARQNLGIAASRVVALGTMGATVSVALTSADTQLVIVTGTVTINAALSVTGMVAGQTLRCVLTQNATGRFGLTVQVNGGTTYSVGLVPKANLPTVFDVFYDGTTPYFFPGMTQDSGGNTHQVHPLGQRHSLWNGTEYYSANTELMYFDGDGLTMNREASIHFAGQTQNTYAQGITLASTCTVAWTQGDVLVADTANTMHFTKIATANSPLVIGVAPNISKGGFPTSGAAASTAYAMTLGVCQVTCDTSAVNIGDLLVTSATNGQAMTNNAPTAGTIIGKALQSKAAGASGKVYATIGGCV